MSRGTSEEPHSRAKFTNRLIRETSPYLRQHAHNPVDWHPWGEEAFEQAKKEDKPVLLSVGYSACHWCHVMERESFEDENTAKIMNENFVCIKVDREERPDVDDIYMKSVLMMTGHGGWPMTVFLLPDGRPFYGGTYYPPSDRMGMPGFTRVLLGAAQAYRTKRGDVLNSARSITEQIHQASRFSPSKEMLTLDILKSSARELLKLFDRTHGGFGTAPKFPHGMDLLLLLRVYRHTQDPDHLFAVEHTLQKMAEGGIYDHLGGGFHRYSVDEQWLVPHFEKMLYDNALLPRTYLEACQLTKNPFYKTVAEETLNYVLREMASPEGGFYSTQDADSEGEEGKFFVWKPEEIKEVLGEKDGELLCRHLGVDPIGNFEHGATVLHTEMPVERLAAEEGVELQVLVLRIREAGKKLFEKREARLKPARDEKILTGWNGLMLGTFARAYQVFENEAYLQAAENAAKFILAQLHHNGRLLSCCKDGQSKLNGCLDDYAHFVGGLIDLYEASFDITWLSHAVRLCDSMIAWFWDERAGGFFFTSHDHEKLIARLKNPYDGVFPSGNSMAAMSLLRLWCYLQKDDYLKKAQAIFRVFREYMVRASGGASYMLCALDFYLSPPKEIVIAGAIHHPQTQEMVRAARKGFFPNKVLAVVPGDNTSAQSPFLLLREKKARNGAPAAYVCDGGTCKNPVMNATELLQLLQ